MSIFIFDLDDVLIHEGFDHPILCNDTIKVLNTIRNKGKLAIASHNDHGLEILKILGIFELFSYIQAYNDRSKLQHFINIIKHFDVNYADCVLFDDLIENINLAKELGMKTILVNHTTGITIDDISEFI